MRSGLRAVGALRSHDERNQDPVALETAVVATGARPGDSAERRQLFTEEAQTVLVFENGAVIRLSAAVADGQLLFLTNKKTGKEVVTQVIRKRSFRPTSCYVDLEFTEPCPGFWGIEFPESAATSPLAAQLSEPEDGQPGAPIPAAPNQQEVERLKNEVAELQTKLKSLIASGQRADAQNAATGAVHTAASTPEPDLSEERGQREEEQRVLEQLLVQEARQERLDGPLRLVGYTRKSRAREVVKKAGKMATAGAFFAVIASAGIATYRFGLLDSVIRKATVANSAPRQPSTPAVRPVSTTKIAPAAPLSSDPVVTGSTGSAPPEVKPATTEKMADTVVAAPPQPSLAPADSSTESSARTASSSVPAKHAPSTGVATSEPKRRGAGPARLSPLLPNTVSSASPPTTPGSANSAEDYVAPKLLHAVKPVSPPDALRNYLTGDVVVDALVDTTGHIKSVTVVSGPPKLRSTAIDVMKQYVYEPAKKNGKAVPSHVQTSLQFWYEP